MLAALGLKKLVILKHSTLQLKTVSLFFKDMDFKYYKTYGLHLYLSKRIILN